MAFHLRGAMIRLRGIVKSFAQRPVLDKIDLDVADGETLVLLGASGCGKTTTLRLINRLADPDAGELTVLDRSIHDWSVLELRRSVGYVFQAIGLFPHLTIRQNVEMTPRLAGWDKSRRRERADCLLDMVGLSPEEFGDRRPRELSGGQQQRVGVARALAADPPILLMDEPFGALDPVSRESLQLEVLNLKSRLGKTIVFVTHDLFEAIMLADRIAVMNAGRIEQTGTPVELLNRPATPFVAAMFERARSHCSRLLELAC